MKPNTGQMYSISSDATYPYRPPRYGQYGEGKLNHQNYSLKPNQQQQQKNQPKFTQIHTILHFQSTTQNIINYYLWKAKQQDNWLLKKLKQKKYLKISLKI